MWSGEMTERAERKRANRKLDLLLVWYNNVSYYGNIETIMAQEAESLGAISG